jgi:hypothetical protein
MDTKPLVAILAHGKPIHEGNKFIMKWGKVSLILVGGLVAGSVMLAINFKAYQKVIHITALDSWVKNKMYTIKSMKNQVRI